jgi:tryptophanase
VNMGGFLATRDADLAREEKVLLILTEGFPTYGGLSGRDLEALAIGMQEAVDEDYLHYRISSTHYVGQHLRDVGIPLLWPTGGHAIYLDAKRFATHLAAQQLPGVAVANAMYQLGGVRACEIGTLMFGSRDSKTGEETAGPRELVRLAIPRRTYTQSHMDYVIEVVTQVWEERASLPGYRIVEQAPFLRHFSAKLEPLA